MKCPECEKEGKTSKVYCRGGTVTAMYSQPYYDEEGRYHSHDPNIHSSSYSCDNGHKFSTSTRFGCKVCGTPDDRQVTVRK